MKRRKSDSRAKTKIVLEGLRGRSVAEIYSQHQISQNQYYQWRDKFLSEAHRAFEGNGQFSREERRVVTVKNLMRRLSVLWNSLLIRSS